MKQIKTLQQAIQHFNDQQVCIDTVAALRWPEGVTCPACGHKEHYYLKTQKRWKCKDCNRQFSVKLGTIFEDSALGLDKWLLAMWMIANCKNGVSSYEIHRAIGVTQKSAWFMLHRIRTAMKNGSLAKLGGPEGGFVEADETFVGPDPRRMHKTRRAKILALAANDPNLNNRAPGKTIVMGMLDREMRQVRAMVVPNVKRATLQEKILNNVEAGSKVITDDFTAYKYALLDKFAHDVINHVEGYVQGQVHTNGIENFWSLLKRGLRGTYVAVEPFHLDRYVDEQVFRFNNRGSKEKPVNDGERFEMLLSQVAGKRLTYSALTGKESETTA
ncbi:MAG TPA: IS1595 family transposase [Candidatus Angelobacter sp.]|jgi:transposase-like protein|nr:IS1595 family transposase [Candidatus Angelobacter sp.]